MFDRFSELVRSDIPCFFYTDFKGEKLHCYPLDELKNHDIEFSFQRSNKPSKNSPHKPLNFPLSEELYTHKFKAVQEHIRAGNTYLLNLTQPTAHRDTLLITRDIYDGIRTV